MAKIGDMFENTRAWMVRITDREDICAREDVIAIGWSLSDRVRDVADHEELKAHIAEHHDWYTARGLGNVAGTVWRFVREIRPNDIVVVLSGNRSGFRLAKILPSTQHEWMADYRENLRDDDSAWCRPIQWLSNQWLSRSEYLSGNLQAALKGRQTCNEITPYLSEILAAAEGQKLSTLGQKISTEAHKYILHALRAHLNDWQLEDLVATLAQREGALEVRRMGRGISREGDVDIEAVHAIRFGSGQINLKVWYQVKQHTGSTDETAVRQLRDRRDSLSSDVAAMVVVSTADEFTDNARQMADESGIELMNGRDIVEWMLRVGFDS